MGPLKKGKSNFATACDGTIYFPFLFSVIMLLLPASSRFLFAETSKQNDYSSYAVINNRNIFYPLWGIADKKPEPAVKVGGSQAEKAQPTPEELEQARLDALKKDYEANLIVTGIINDNGEAQAGLFNKRSSKSYMVRKNDFVDELQVVSIDEPRKEIILDYQKKFVITLHFE